MSRFIFIIIIFIFISCKNNNEHDEAKTPVISYKESLVHANKLLVKNENDEIEALIKRYNWNMQKTGSGLRYMIYKSGNGLQAKTGMIARMKYQINLINGVKCYESEKVFQIGKGGVESGIEEAILLLKVGDKAKFIIPSHLGFGLLGDQNKIPKRATLIYDIELIQLKENSKK